jgi:60 kDa SS-A/Ro ribonucleoprotein
MAKFNSNGTKNEAQATETNMAGGKAYAKPFKLDFAGVILNSMLNGDSYYESDASRISEIEKMITSNTADLEFVAKAMVYTRTKGNLRSVSHLVAVLLAEAPDAKGNSWLRKSFYKTVVRPDDMTEITALWNTRNAGKMLPNSLRRAFKDSLESKFDAYQLKKYEGLSNSVKLRDVVKMARPKPFSVNISKEAAKEMYKAGYTLYVGDNTFSKDALGAKWGEVKASIKGDIYHKDIFKQVIEGNLPKIETAQTVNAGTKAGEDRSAKYVEMLRNKKLGYMAALKNMKTILEGGITDEDLALWTSYISNAKAIENSKILPNRFVDAWDAVKTISLDRFKVKAVKKALETAFTHSARNTNLVEGDEKIALMLDDSYSMQGKPFNTGRALMGAMLAGLEADKTLGYLWSDRAQLVDTDVSGFNFIEKTECRGGGTNIGAALEALIANRTVVDKVVIFTDMQCYGWSRYSNLGSTVVKYIKEYKKINKNVKVLFWNLEGYNGTSPYNTHQNGILELSGYSDKMLELIPALWGNKDGLVKDIEAIEL